MARDQVRAERLKNKERADRKKRHDGERESTKPTKLRQGKAKPRRR